ncbi:MAG: cob(I)yrinic acid a,c-diamide adenosyltransferase [Flavobacteriia bacterium]|nr:cob(I)yrinic acid a,c-diamide adenosyltransferase [Flavobacteriia bacterium]
MKIYTKTGDGGQTSLLNGTRVSKAELRLEAYGTLDELNSHLGVLVAQANAHFPLSEAIQSQLFAMGSHLALEGQAEFPMPKWDEELVGRLEQQIDSWNEQLPELKNFVLPGGCASSAQCHVARTVCRRAERVVVALSETAEVNGHIPAFLNRLSDYLFVMARWMDFSAGAEDRIWTPKY